MNKTISFDYEIPADLLEAYHKLLGDRPPTEVGSFCIVIQKHL